MSLSLATLAGRGVSLVETIFDSHVFPTALQLSLKELRFCYLLWVLLGIFDIFSLFQCVLVLLLLLLINLTFLCLSSSLQWRPKPAVSPVATGVVAKALDAFVRMVSTGNAVKWRDALTTVPVEALAAPTVAVSAPAGTRGLTAVVSAYKPL